MRAYPTSTGYRRRAFAQRAAASLCRTCGRHPVTAGVWRCEPCREHRRRLVLLRTVIQRRCLRCPASVSTCGRGRAKRWGQKCARHQLLARIASREAPSKARQFTVSDARWRYLTGEERG